VRGKGWRGSRGWGRNSMYSEGEGLEREQGMGKEYTLNA